MGKAFIICGAPGAGKSTYGAGLARREGRVLLDIDTCTEGLIQVALKSLDRNPDDRDSEYFKNTFRDPIYQTLFDIAKENLPWVDVVIVGPFTREIRDNEWYEKLKTDLGAEVEIHYIYCDISERKVRLERRNNVRDLLKLKDWDNHVKYFGDEQPPQFPHVFVNTSKGVKV